MAHQHTDHVEEEVPTVWRAGKDALIPAEGALFPDRCVICNGPTGWYRRLTHVAEMPWWVSSLLVVAGIVATPIGAVVCWRILKYIIRAWTLPLPLCLKHRRRPGMGTAIRIIGWIGVAASFVCFCSGAISACLALLGLGFATAFGGDFYSRVARVKKAQGEWLYLRIGRRFVESLPPVPGADPGYRHPAGAASTLFYKAGLASAASTAAPALPGAAQG